MYIWLGIDVDSQLCELKKTAMRTERDLGLTPSCYTLPMHISLKMSFEIDAENFDAIVADIERYYESLVPFTVSVRGIEDEGAIIWLRMSENEQLNRIHDDLNEMLASRWNIGLHEYDTDYKFHTTLFMSIDSAKMRTAYERVANAPIPDKLFVNRLVIGRSDSGALGSYSVYKTVTVG